MLLEPLDLIQKSKATDIKRLKVTNPIAGKRAEKREWNKWVKKKVIGFLSLLTCFGSLAGLWLTRNIAQYPDPNSSTDTVLSYIAHATAIETYLPGVFKGTASIPILRWVLNYMAVVFVVLLVAAIFWGFVYALIIVKPKTSISEDPLFRIQHFGVDTPLLNHLPDVALVCPVFDWTPLIDDFILARLDPTAPEAKAVRLTDTPSRGKEVEFDADGPQD